MCLVDDGSTASHIQPLLAEFAALDRRIKVKSLDSNQGISEATNRAAALATGEYLAFLDHDDELTMDALYQVARAINRHDPEVLYSDEELIDEEGRLLDRFNKPDFNPELLFCHNFITHLLVCKRMLFERVGGLDKGCAGAQDFDLLLKLSETRNQRTKIYHIRRSLYKWRATATSTSVNHSQKDYADAAGKLALEAAVSVRSLDAEVRAGQWKYYYELRRRVQGTPTVSIISLLPDSKVSVLPWLEELMGRTRYPSVTVHLISSAFAGGNDEPLPDSLADKVFFHEYEADESVPAALNRVSLQASGDYLVFLRPGLQPEEEEWIQTFLGYLVNSEYGVVGGLVKQTGEESNKESKDPAVPDIHDWSCAAFTSFLIHASYHLNGIVCPQNVLAASMDFSMVPRALFEQVNGFDADSFPEALYGVDLCLRIRELGLESVFTPYCQAKSLQENPPPARSCKQERTRFQEQWQQLLVHNPFYNENRLLLEEGVSREDWLHWIVGNRLGMENGKRNDNKEKQDD